MQALEWENQILHKEEIENVEHKDHDKDDDEGDELDKDDLDKMMVMVAKMIKEERKGTAGVELHQEFGGIGFKEIPLPAKSSRSKWRCATEIETHQDEDAQLRSR